MSSQHGFRQATPVHQIPSQMTDTYERKIKAIDVQNPQQVKEMAHHFIVGIGNEILENIDLLDNWLGVIGNRLNDEQLAAARRAIMGALSTVDHRWVEKKADG
jgi:hypothetical protein